MALIGAVSLCAVVGYQRREHSGPKKSPESNQLGGQISKPNVADNNEVATSNNSDNVPAPQVTAPPLRSSSVTINNKEYPVHPYKLLMMPNDPLVSQWWVTNMSLDDMWDIPAGSEETVMAVIDTGFALAHEEFQNRWFVNPGESGVASSEAPSVLNCTGRSLPLSASCNLIDDNSDGIVDNETGSVVYQNPSKLNCTAQSKPLTKDCNNIDDDSNGYVDDVTGWDFINYDSSVQAGQLNPTGNGTKHGTIVTGAAAATGNNGKGIAGVNWQTKILPIQALDDDAYGDTLSVSRSISYAADMGVDVISLSLGSDYPDDLVRDAVQYAIAKGIIVVAAAGNDGCDCMLYPANYPEVVAVGALNTNNTPASFSSWGTNLDILAPGVSIDSATWSAGNPTSDYYYDAAGTSLATPLVSGLLARLASQQPQATPIQLMAALAENTNRLTLGASTPRSNTLGFGTADAYKANNRMYQPLELGQNYVFKPISNGLFPIFSVSEEANNSQAASCPSNTVGTTPIFELNNSILNFFTISYVENYKAQQSGYSSSLFAYTCMQQPHDTAQVSRYIDIFHEFKNTYTKLLY